MIEKLGKGTRELVKCQESWDNSGVGFFGLNNVQEKAVMEFSEYFR